MLHVVGKADPLPPIPDNFMHLCPYQQNGYTPVHVACQHGRTDIALLLLEKHASLSATGVDESTPLHLASQGGHAAVVKLLIQRGADVDATDKRGNTPLHLACSEGRTEVAEHLLLLDDSSLNDSTHDGFSPMHMACRNGHLPIVELLFAKGVVVSAAIKDTSTPLHLASRSGHQPVADFLIQKGASVAATDRNGYTPLHEACAHGHADVVELLLPGVVSEALPDYDGCTPLHLASRNGHTRVAVLLLQRGAVASEPNKFHRTPLHEACANNHAGVAKVVLEKVQSAACKDLAGITPLHLACQEGHLGIVDLLLEQDKSLARAPDNIKRTPLHEACYNNHPDVAELLLVGESWVSPADKDGSTPLHLACREGHIAVVKLLLQRRAVATVTDTFRRTPLHEACANNQVDVAELLLAGGVPVSPRDMFGSTPFHLASQNGHVAVAELLLDSGASVKATGNYQCTALHEACSSGHVEVVRLLLKKGASVTATDDGGRTPLHLASQDGHEKVAEALLQSGAVLTAIDKKNSTSLDIAARRYGTSSCMILLLRYVLATMNSDDALELVQKAADQEDVDSTNGPILKSYIAMDEFFAKGVEKARDIVAMISGARDAGKSAVIRMLRSEKDNVREGDSEMESHKGIVISSLDDTLGNVVHFKDMGGEEDFCVTHDVFSLSSTVPTIGVIVVDGTLPCQEIKRSISKTAGKFLSLRQPSLRTAPGEVNRLTVIGVATRFDKIGPEKVQKIAKVFNDVSKEIHSKPEQGLFMKYFDAVDARTKDRKFQVVFAQKCNDELEKARQQPKILREARDLLFDLREKYKDTPFTTKETFADEMCELCRLSVPAESSELVPDQIFHYTKVLTEYGLVISFQSERFGSIIVNQPDWLLQYIVGIVFWPSNLSGPRIPFVGGEAWLLDVLNVLNDCRGAKDNGPLVLHMLAELGLVRPHGKEVFAPSKLPSARGCLGTMSGSSTAGDEFLCAGMLFECAEPSCFSDALVVLVQTRLYAYFVEFHDTISTLHKNVIEVFPADSLAWGCISFATTKRQAVAVVRAPREDRQDIVCLLDLLCRFFRDMVRVHRQWAKVVEEVLSADSIRRHLSRESAEFDFESYSPVDVKKSLAADRRSLVRGQKSTDKAADLLYYPANHSSLLSPSALSRLDKSLLPRRIPKFAKLLQPPLSESRPESNVQSVSFLVESWAATSCDHTTTVLYQKLSDSADRRVYADMCQILEEEEQKLLDDFPDIFRDSVSRTVAMATGVSEGHEQHTMQDRAGLQPYVGKWRPEQCIAKLQPRCQPGDDLDDVPDTPEDKSQAVYIPLNGDKQLGEVRDLRTLVEILEPHLDDRHKVALARWAVMKINSTHCGVEHNVLSLYMNKYKLLEQGYDKWSGLFVILHYLAAQANGPVIDDVYYQLSALCPLRRQHIFAALSNPDLCWE